jgi:hypothetical protein
METAVEWLVEQITKHTWYDEEGFGHVSVSILDINKAKEMEKQQITDAYVAGGEKGFNKFGEDYEQYYKETFNND